ncbi:MAG: PD40 domain-containing protein [Anaerolineales bacterium]|nr:PD40 domain-containing protein [Anaerolineales bacterium]
MDTKFTNILLRGVTLLTLLSILTFTLPSGAPPVHAAPGDITRVSADSSGAEANGGSTKPAISDDGRFVAFESGASNLVSGDTNNADDIFVHDRQTDQTTRVSVSSSGVEANGYSSSPAISGDGRYVAFYTDATNLVSGDTNGCGDIFVHDRQTGQTTRVSVSSSGVEENAPPPDDYLVLSISGNGRYVAFYSDATNLVSGDTNGATDIFVHDLQTGTTTRASVASDGTEANAGSREPSLSGDGRYIAFVSGATNLVAEDTNGKGDVFVRDLQAGTTTRASVNSSEVEANGGGYNPDISGDGRYVVFLSKSRNLDPRATDFGGYNLAYVRDLQVGQTTLASVSSSGDVLGVGDIDMPTLSRDGRYVAFEFREHGDPTHNTYVYDLLTGDFVSAVHGPDEGNWPSISANGSFIAFSSNTSTLVSGDTNGQPDIFVSEVSYGPERSPTVASITPECGTYSWLCPLPTPASVSFIVIFSEQVTGVTADDFSLNMLDGVSGASTTGVSGYGNQYFVSVNTGTGDGRLRLDLVDDDSIVDSALNPLGGPGIGNGNKSGTSYYIDKSVPMVTSITRADPNPTGAENVHFTVTFSENVWPVDASDFALSTTGSISGAAITGVIDLDGDGRGSDTTYTVTVNTGTGDGTLRLDLIDDDSIRDDIDNPLGGAGAGNGNFTTGETYTINKSGPSAPSVTSSLRADPDPTLADIVSFTVTFSEAVSGVDTGDFTLTTTGSLNGSLVANISGAEAAYTVLVATGNGDGGLHLDLIDDDSILNASGIPLGGPGAGNGNFIAGEAYTVDKTVPLVTGSLRADANPTAADNVNFTVVFTEAVSGVDLNDFFLSTSGTISGAAITGINGSGYLYTVTASTGSGDGTLRLDVLDDDSILDTVGHPMGGAGLGNGNFTTGEEYTLNRTPVNVNLVTETFRSNGNNDGWVLESSEDSEQGGSRNANGPVFVLGDNDQDQQFRAILHFPTHYLPDNAVITRALLMIKKEGLVGEDPFTTHQNILVDIRSGAFGFIGPFPYRGLQVSDFQSPAHKDAVGMIENNPFNGWYWAWLDSSAFEYVSRTGITQIRLRFQIDDNDDLGSDHLRLYSGDYVEQGDRPRLVVEYYLSR